MSTTDLPPAFPCPMDGQPLRSAVLAVNEPSRYVHEDGTCHSDGTDWLTSHRFVSVMALFCGDEHWITGALCKVIGPHDLHDYDGLPDWAAAPSETPKD